MFHAARLACCAALVGLFFLVAYAVRPAVLTDFGIDLADWPNQLRDLNRELERREALKQKFLDFWAMNRAKDQIGLDLIAGRLTLAQAVRGFCDLAEWPEQEYRRLLRRRCACATDEECLCRHVLGWTCDLLENEPSRQEAVRRRLEAELREHLRQLPGGR